MKKILPLIILFSTSTQALTIIPTQGQTPQQISRDQTDCSNFATNQTGFNPNAPQTQQNNQVLRQGARGAAAGAAIGAVAGNAGRGAAIGATAGGVRGTLNSVDQNRAQQNQANSQNAFNNSLRSCLASRGYSVQ